MKRAVRIYEIIRENIKTGAHHIFNLRIFQNLEMITVTSQMTAGLTKTPYHYEKILQNFWSYNFNKF